MKKATVKPRKVQTDTFSEPVETVKQVVVAPIQTREPVRHVERVVSDTERIAESRKVLDVPLAPGQQFFETPDGEIIIGEADKTAVWSRRMNGGKGGWVNPRR